MAQRNELFYPPFSRISRIILSGSVKITVENLANQIGIILQSGTFQTLGPSPAPIEKIQGQWRYHIVIKVSPETPFLFHKFLQKKLGLEILSKKTRGVRVQIDMDPVTMLQTII